MMKLRTRPGFHTDTTQTAPTQHPRSSYVLQVSVTGHADVLFGEDEHLAPERALVGVVLVSDPRLRCASER